MTPHTDDYLSDREQGRLLCSCGCPFVEHTEYGCKTHGMHEFRRTYAKRPRFRGVAMTPRHAAKRLTTGDYCGFCGLPWPCDTKVESDRADAAEAREAALREALKKIVAMDYRGNEPPEQSIARKALSGAAMTKGDVELPWFCLTCGYGEVPGEDFNAHECDDFRRLPKEAQAANRDATYAETQRRLTPAPEV